MTVLLNPHKASQLDFAYDLLFAGEPIGVPSETVYGLAAPVNSDQGVARIFSLKRRPSFDPLIVHLAHRDELPHYVREINELQGILVRAFWPGPLTILFKRDERIISDLLTSGSPWVAIRQPSHPIFQKLIKRVGIALAAPSANRFGKISPTSAQDVIDELGPRGLEAVIEGGRCERGIESTVVKVLDNDNIEIVRLGAISLEDIQNVIAKDCHIEIRPGGSGAQVDAPGQLLSHYAPRSSLAMCQNLSDIRDIDGSFSLGKSVLLKFYQDSVPDVDEKLFKSCFVLSKGHSDTEAAASFFKTLREIDKQAPELIVAMVPSDPQRLERAIVDRIKRAVHIQK